jgi:hypothetical protein
MSPPWWTPLQPLPTLKRTRRTLPLLLSSPGGASDRRHAPPTPASSEPTLSGAPIHAGRPGARLPATQRDSFAVPLQQKPLQPRATGGLQPRAYLSRGLRPAAAPCFWRARFGRSASSPTNTAAPVFLRVLLSHVALRLAAGTKRSLVKVAGAIHATIRSTSC